MIRDSGDPGMNPLVQSIMLANWARRTLSDDVGTDVGTRALLADLQNEEIGLPLYCAEESRALVTPLAQSIAWCYLAEFRAREGGDPLVVPAVEEIFGADNTACVGRLSYLLDPKDARGDPRVPAPHYRSLEVGLQQVVRSIRLGDDGAVVDENRTIMAVHYLLCLACAVHKRVYQDEDTPGVVAQATGDGPLARAVAERRHRAPRSHWGEDLVARVYELSCRVAEDSAVRAIAESQQPLGDTG